jgi:YidC/Oxa1 family membrane protein insertase
MDLYKENKINPLSSCLPLLIQLPILIALYQVFSKALHGNLNGLYHFVSNPGTINPKLFNLIDLSQPNIWFGVVAGLAQFWQSRMMISKTKPTDPTAKAMNIQMMYVLPVISAIVAIRLPAGLPLYWIVTTLFAIAQQYYIQKRHPAPTV